VKRAPGRSWSHSITGRLVLLLTTGVTVLWLVGALISSAILQHELNESFDRAQAEVARRLLPLMTDSLFDRDEADGDVHEIHHLPVDGERALVYQLRSPGGHLLVKSDDAPDAPLDGNPEQGFADAGQYRVFTLVDRQTGLTIQVGELLSHRTHAVWGSTLTLFLPLMLLIPLSAVGIWYGARSGLAPLSRLRQEIASRDSANLNPIASAGLPAELVPIVVALSSLMLRLKSALEGERQFAANSAHELRTPIAAALAQTQRLLETTRDEAALANGRKVEATLRRIARLAEKLMQLARADAGMAVTGEPTAVLPVLRLIIADTIARSGRVIELHAKPGAESLKVAVNIDALGIVLRNLVDNAISHSPAESKVEIEVSGAMITVRNESPVIPADAVERLRARFERGATTAPGSGLGLAIVDTILRQVGGELRLNSPADGVTGGFEATLIFPTSHSAEPK
jgi:two-component system OmpR family sensor kinase